MSCFHKTWVLAAGLAAAGLSGCATPAPGQETPIITAGGMTVSPATPAQTVPFYSPVDLVERIDDTGSIYNTLGGELPASVPIPQVEQGALEEITSDQQG